MINVALPTLQREMDLSTTSLQWIAGSCILVFAILLLPVGAFGHRLGWANVLQAGIFIFATASLGAMFAQSAAQLIAAGVVMGIGAVLIVPAAMATIASVFPPEERGKATGVWVGACGAGIAVGPVLGGLSLEYFSTSAIFLLSVPIVAVALVAGRFLVPSNSEPHSIHVGLPRAMLLATALSILVFGIIKGGDWGWTHSTVIATLAMAIMSGILLFNWKRRTSDAMRSIRPVSRPPFSADVGSIGLLALGLFGVLFTLTQYMQFVVGYSTLETGIRLAPTALLMAIGVGVSDWMVGHFGTARVVTIYIAAFILMVFLASFSDVEISYGVLGLVIVSSRFLVAKREPSKRTMRWVRQQWPIIIICLILFSVGVPKHLVRAELNESQLSNLSLSPNCRADFVVFGDSQGSIGDIWPVAPVFDDMLSLIDEIDVPMAFHVGDMYSGDAVFGTDVEEQAQYFLNDMQNWHNAWFPVMGNHDARGNGWEVSRELIFNNENTYYSFDDDDCHFIILDAFMPDYACSISDEQMAWLENDLRMTTKRHVFVFVHAPLYPSGTKIGESLDKDPDFRDRLASLLVEHGVDVVFCGHEHYYASFGYLGLMQVTTGGAGGELRHFKDFDEFVEECHYDSDGITRWKAVSTLNYVGVTTTSDSIDITAYDLEGNVIDHFILPTQMRSRGGSSFVLRSAYREVRG